MHLGSTVPHHSCHRDRCQRVQVPPCVVVVVAHLGHGHSETLVVSFFGAFVVVVAGHKAAKNDFDRIYNGFFKKVYNFLMVCKLTIFSFLKVTNILLVVRSYKDVVELQFVINLKVAGSYSDSCLQNRSKKMLL